MKILFMFLSLLTIAYATVVTDKEWAEYKDKYGKKYTGYEDTRRRLNLLNNKIYINLHNMRANSGLVSYNLAVNQFSDITRIQFYQMLGGNNYATNQPRIPRSKKPAVLNKLTPQIPMYRNWTQDGAGYKVLNQGFQCNAAWAFSALSAIEGHFFQVNTKLPSKLSAQNIIDCAGGIGSCDGSEIPETAYEYIEYQMNVNTDLNYPYTGKKSFCKYDPNDVGCQIGGFQTINDDDDHSLLHLVAWETPVVVGFNPFSFEFMHYDSGIFVPPRNPININDKYFMTVVGYGTNESLKQDFWILKNSMGQSWGDFGYMKVIRSKDYLLAKHASFPNL